MSQKKPFLNRFIVGPLGVNCYVVADQDTKEACLIDPGADGDKLKRFLAKSGFELKFIVNTHGHGDHIGSNKDFQAPVYIHRLDKDCLTDPGKNLSADIFFFSVKSPAASRLLEDGDRIKLGGLEFTVIHTPGHTRGSICLKMGDVIFTGDTLFAGGVGRTDLDGGDEEELFRSIREKLFVFGDDVVIYPGHGGESTIGTERIAIG